MVIVLSVSLPLTFSQARVLGGLDTSANRAGYEEKDLIKISGNVLNVVLSFVGVLFLLMMIAGGFIWMTAAGQPTRVQLAQRLLVAGIIGFIIVVSAYVITTFIGDSLNLGTGGTATTTP